MRLPFISINWILLSLVDIVFTLGTTGAAKFPANGSTGFKTALVSLAFGTGLLPEQDEEEALALPPESVGAANSANTNSRLAHDRDGKDMATEKHTVSALRPDGGSQVRPAWQGKQSPRRRRRRKSRNGRSSSRSPLSSSLPGDFRRRGAPEISKQTAVVFSGHAKKKRKSGALNKLAIDLQGPAALYLPKLLGPHAVNLQTHRPSLPSPYPRHHFYYHHHYPVPFLLSPLFPCHHLHYRYHRMRRVDDGSKSNVTTGNILVASLAHGCQERLALAGRIYKALPRSEVLQVNTEKNQSEEADGRDGAASRTENNRIASSVLEKNRASWKPTRHQSDKGSTPSSPRRPKLCSLGEENRSSNQTSAISGRNLALQVLAILVNENKSPRRNLFDIVVRRKQRAKKEKDTSGSITLQKGENLGSFRKLVFPVSEKKQQRHTFLTSLKDTPTAKEVQEDKSYNRTVIVSGNFDPVYPDIGNPERKRLRRSLRSSLDLSWISRVPTILHVLPDLRCLSMFLAGHKYFGFDPRKGNQISWRYRSKGFHTSFPRPHLKKLHRDAVEACQDSAVECFRRLAGVALRTTILSGTSCAKQRKMPLPAGAGPYYPFETALDLFRFRTAATYYMCWHTMNNRDFLEYIKVTKNRTCLGDLELNKLKEPFDNQKRIIDYRTDKVPFQCALIAFCPDPCYGRKTKGHVPNYDFLAHRDPGNPCRALRDQTCGWEMVRNRNFDSLQRNRFNISCQCAKERKGYVWNSKYHLCVDEDECQKKEIRAKCGQGKRCQNTVGGYQCMCQAGYLRHPDTRDCFEHMKLARPVVNHSLTNARHVHKMLQAESSGSFLEKQIEAALGMSSGRWPEPGTVHLLICAAVSIWCPGHVAR